VQWWTFAGGRVNTTLKYAFEAITPWKVVPDNYVVRLRGDGDRARDLDEAMARISEPAFWEDDGLWGRIAGSLPEYRLSKFQDVLPAAAAREMLASFLLDVPRARAVAVSCVGGPSGS
jgi:ATP-dependent helicase Lhr and Lhr-like helicase